MHMQPSRRGDVAPAELTAIIKYAAVLWGDESRGGLSVVAIDAGGWGILSAVRRSTVGRRPAVPALCGGWCDGTARCCAAGPASLSVASAGRRRQR
eukprot:SAG31_NODE_15944_length_730_cov_1.305864_1_plen_96_part_01